MEKKHNNTSTTLQQFLNIMNFYSLSDDTQAKYLSVINNILVDKIIANDKQNKLQFILDMNNNIDILHSYSSYILDHDISTIQTDITNGTWKDQMLFTYCQFIVGILFVIMRYPEIEYLEIYQNLHNTIMFNYHIFGLLETVYNQINSYLENGTNVSKEVKFIYEPLRSIVLFHQKKEKNFNWLFSYEKNLQ